ncbi:hypothetical protein CYMTET_4369 [Cymbomonas tetramitiformis]|uniref:NACHT domain-containing protein n=1 Tax=Cymbomonas tetramitiformis TaxID=36881 RepID=A0AAE0H1B8_9CHLO|nr:hypothetical protein CYMTET_4369 [Cymbomonas tetramitiformis]
MGCGSSCNQNQRRFQTQGSSNVAAAEGSPPLPKQSRLVDTSNSANEHRGAKNEEPAEDAAAAEVGASTRKQPQLVDARNSLLDEQQDAEKEAAGRADSVKLQSENAYTALRKEVMAGTLSHTLSFGQPAEAAQTLARLHAALDHSQIRVENEGSSLLDMLFTAAKHCTGDAALLGRLVFLLCCVHRMLLLTTQLDDGGDLSEKKAQWKKEADQLRGLCVSRFHSAAQSFGGTALLELHLSQVQLTQVHLPARKLSSQVASAAVNITAGAAKMMLVGSYGTLVKGLGQAMRAGIDAAGQKLSQSCFEQLKALSKPPADADKLEEWLKKMHSEHFQCGEDGQWEPKGKGRWEPKAAFSVMLADLVAARPPRMTPKLLEMICLGGKDFIGLTNLMALGSHSAADVDARHVRLVNLTLWAQEVVLQTLEESQTSPDAPDQAAATAQSAEQVSSDDADGHGLQVLAEELERVIQEGKVKLATSAEQLTAAVAEGLSKQVEDVLVCGVRDAVVCGKPQAVAALAACNSVLDVVEESLQGVHAAAVACQPLLHLTSKLLRSFSMLYPDAIVEGVIGRALQELEQAERSVETRLQIRLTKSPGIQNYVNELGDVLIGSLSSGCASTSTVESQQAADARLSVPSEKVAELSPRDAVKDSLTWLLSEEVVAELRPLLGALQAFLGLIKGPASKDSHEGARRELMQLAIELDAEVARVAQKEVERCMVNAERCAKEGVAARGPHEVKLLVGRLLESLPGAVKEWLVPALRGICQKLGQSADESSKKKIPSLPSEFIDAIVYVDASMATLQQVLECAAACERLLRTHVRAPLSKAHAHVSGEARGNTSGGWVPSFFTGRKKRQQASASRAQAEACSTEDPELWQHLQLALGGLERILRKIAGTELTAGRTEEGGKVWEDAVQLLSKAAGEGVPLMALLSSEEGAPPQHAVQTPASKGAVQVSAAFLQLSLHLKQTQALAGSLQTASQRLNLRAVAQVQTQVEKDFLVAGRQVLLEVVKDRVQEITLRAQEQLADWADQCTDNLGDVATSALGDTCGALLAPALGLLGEVVNGRKNRLTTHTWQVREVAILGALRALDAMRHDAAALHDDAAALHDAAAAAGRSARAEVQATMRTVRKLLQEAVLLRLSLECGPGAPSVQALQRNGEALAAELNVPLRAEELRKAMEGEHESRVKREREKERERLAAAERHEAWAQAQHVVRQTIDAQLLELDELQKAVAREPDLLQKQLLLVRCRDIHTALAQSSRNVSDIGAGIGVVVGFLTTVNDKLDVVNESLQVLQAGVRELGADLKRLVGRPVLEELAEQTKQCARRRRLLREIVHIPINAMYEDDTGTFVEAQEGNLPQGMLAAVREQFLDREDKSVLLLAGPAGSGKSTFVQELELLIETSFAEERLTKHGETVVLVKVSLPTLQSPMTDLFREALVSAYNLREAQIHELRDLARDGKIRLIFLLDAYDELKPQFQFKNLYVSNSLEQYRARASVQDNTGGGEARCDPKVIITVRTEMLTNRKRAEYAEAFMPMEMESNNRSKAQQTAWARFLELRIAPFTNQVSAYIHAKVALEVRCELEQRLGPLAPLSEKAAAELCVEAGKVLPASEGLPNSVGSGSLNFNTKELLAAASQAVAVPGGRDLPVSPEMLKLLCTGCSQGFMVAAVQAAALEDRPQDLDTALQELCAQIEKGDRMQRIWMFEEYQRALDAIPELQELTTTPFMVEIVTKILPELQGVPAAADSSMRAKLLLLLDEEAAQIAWGCISRWRLQGDKGEALEVLEQVQKSLGEGDRAGLAPLTVLAKDVSEMLGSREILMEQSTLAEMAKEWLQARSPEADVEAALQDLLREVAVGAMMEASLPAEELRTIDAQPLELKDLQKTVACEPDLLQKLRRAIDTQLLELEELQKAVAREPDALQKQLLLVRCRKMHHELGIAVQSVHNVLKEATPLEDAIRSQAIPHALRSALRRPPVRRFRIYAMFLEYYVKREAAKARVAVKGYDSEMLQREGAEYAQHLALQMVAEGVSKVPLRSGSELFHRKSVWDPFLRGGGELREAALKAAPVRCTGGVLTFIHKTVQEFLCAAGLRGALRRILRELAVPLEALMRQLEPNLGPAVVASEEARVRQGYQTVRWAAGTGASRRADGEQARGWPHELSGDAGSIAGGTQEVDQMTVAKALRRVGTGLVESEWAQVDLRQESVVRDFLADCVLDEPEFTEEVQFLATWAELWCKGGRLAGTGGVDGGGLLGNVRAVLGGALPKRSGGALLHAAAADGSHFTVSVLLKLLRGAGRGAAGGCGHRWPHTAVLRGATRACAGGGSAACGGRKA